MKHAKKPTFDKAAIARIARLAAAQKNGNFDEQFAREFPTAKTDLLPEIDPNKIEILIPRKKR
jgi:hypothetical protein